MKKICIWVLFLSHLILTHQYQYTLAVDLPEVILDPFFYKCIAGRIHFHIASALILPYSSTNDFALAMVYAKQAGFSNVHLLVDPMEFVTADPTTVVENMQASLMSKGINVQGVWISVFQNSSAWQISPDANVRMINNILSAFSAALPQTSRFGFFTTYSDWIAITDGATSLASGHFYWSAWGDSIPPPNTCNGYNIKGFSNCYFQQIRVGNNACGYLYNLNVLRPF